MQKFLLFFILIFSVTTPIMAIVDPELDPSCLNCCEVEELSEWCDEEVESSFLKDFLIHRHFVGVPILLSLAGSLVRGFQLSPLLLVQASLLKVTAINLYQILKPLRKWFIPKKKSTEQIQGIVIVLRSSEDWNFALTGFSFQDLAENHLVLFKSVDSAGEIKSVIDNVKDRFHLPIKTLILLAHGSETLLQVGKDFILYQDLHRLEPAFHSLDLETDIVIMSCFNGYGSLAMGIALIAGGRRVYSSKDLMTPFSSFDPETLKPNLRSFLVFINPIPFLDIGLWFGLSVCFREVNNSLVPCHE